MTDRTSQRRETARRLRAASPRLYEAAQAGWTVACDIVDEAYPHLSDILRRDKIETLRDAMIDALDDGCSVAETMRRGLAEIGLVFDIFSPNFAWIFEEMQVKPGDFLLFSPQYRHKRKV